MNHFAPLPLTHHQMGATYGNHLLHDIINWFCRAFGYRLGNDFARMFPDWLVVVIGVAIAVFVIVSFVKRHA